jgi:hypothetical protein
MAREATAAPVPDTGHGCTLLNEAAMAASVAAFKLPEAEAAALSARAAG